MIAVLDCFQMHTMAVAKSDTTKIKETVGMFHYCQHRDNGCHHSSKSTTKVGKIWRQLVCRHRANKVSPKIYLNKFCDYVVGISYGDDFNNYIDR